MPPSRPKLLLFDLGGVVVRWNGINELSALSGLSRAQVLEKLKIMPEFATYEIGQCSDNDFANAMIAEFDFNFTTSQFKALWNSWVGQPYTGVVDTLITLKKDYTIACLSNTNALHWAWMSSYIDMDTVFHTTFASHLIHAAMPTPESYQRVATDMCVNLEDIWFFDDTLANIEAAKTLGITAFLIDPLTGVLPKLRALDLI